MTLKSNAKAPISSHPLFPGAIAAWFALLFGLGSLVLRAGLLERAVLALRIDLLVPAATPPLSFTARLLVALLLALGGALTGYTLARTMGRRAASAAIFTPNGAAASAKAYAPVAAEYHDDDPLRLDAARDGLPPRRRSLTAPESPAGSLSSFAPVPPAVPVPAIVTLGAVAAMQPLITEQPDPPARDLAEAGPAAVAPTESVPLTQAADEATRESFTAAASPAATAADILRSAPLHSLGMVELVERFAIALEKRREQDARAFGLSHAQAPLTATAPAPFADPNPPAPAADRPFDMPALLRPAFPNGSVDWFDDTDGPEAADSAARFSSQLGVKPSGHPAATEMIDLPMRPLGAPFRPQAEATEASLHAALAKLRRMRGAA